MRKYQDLELSIDHGPTDFDKKSALNAGGLAFKAVDGSRLNSFAILKEITERTTTV